MGLERAAAWVAGYLAVALALALAGLVTPGGSWLALPFWLPVALALETATAFRSALGPVGLGPTAFSAVALVVVALEGVALVAVWVGLRAAGDRVAVALGNP